MKRPHDRYLVVEAKIVHRLPGGRFPPGLFLMLIGTRNGGWYSELIRLDEKEKEITPHRPKAW